MVLFYRQIASLNSWDRGQGIKWGTTMLQEVRESDKADMAGRVF